jgi:hypothetical protein
MWSREDPPRNVIFDGPNQRRLASGRLQYRFDQKGGCALSICAGNSSVRNALGRTFVEIRAQPSKRAASTHDLCPANRRARRFARSVGDDGNRSGSDGLIDEAIAVVGLALHGDKHSSGAHSPGIVFHTRNGRVSALGENLGALQELLERHWSDYK